MRNSLDANFTGLGINIGAKVFSSSRHSLYPIASVIKKKDKFVVMASELNPN
jgi:hypothetical protein